MVLGIYGRMQSGKSTIANILVNGFGFIEVAFATSLKDMLVKAHICTYDEVYKEKTAYSREMMQKIGTDLVRYQIDPNFWCSELTKTIMDLYAHGLKKIVVSDIRFQNEYDLVKKYFKGTILKVERDTGIVNDHISETVMDSFVPDYTIKNDGSIEILRAYVKEVLYLIEDETRYQLGG
jgi:dephospho-CoA kinase